MWASILEAAMRFLLAVWKDFAKPAGGDAPSNTAVKQVLDDNLGAWEKKTGADKCDLPRRPS
jgi:hypothetical protein